MPFHAYTKPTGEPSHLGPFELNLRPPRAEVQHDPVLEEIRALRRELADVKQLLTPYLGRLVVGPEVSREYQRLKGKS